MPDNFNDINRRNSGLNFVKRGLFPNNYPFITNRDKSISTHKLAYAGVDNGFIVYPTIVQKGNKLIELDGNSAIDYAIKNKQFIKFNTEDLAKNIQKTV